MQDGEKRHADVLNVDFPCKHSSSSGGGRVALVGEEEGKTAPPPSPLLVKHRAKARAQRSDLTPVWLHSGINGPLRGV